MPRRDSAARTRAARRLRRLRHELQRAVASQRQLRLITDAAPVCIAQWDREGRFRFANRACGERFGLDPERVAGRTLADVLGEEVGAVLRGPMAAALSGRRAQFEAKLPHRELGARTLHVSYVPEFDEHGGVAGVIALMSDVTERRRAERSLHQREREFKTLAENSPDVIGRLDPDLRLLYINRAAEAAFGLPAERFIGRLLDDTGLPPLAVTACSEAVRGCLRSGREQGFGFRVHTPGRTRHFTGRAIPELDRSGAIETVLTIVYDVTQRAESERERDSALLREQAAREQAEAAAAARDQFLAVVSHELRSPLNGIQSWAHVLEQHLAGGGDSSRPAVERALAGIRTGVAQQVRLIEDLLDATRIVSGQLRLVRQPFALAPVLQAALESVRAHAATRGVRLHVDLALGDEQVEGDPDRVQQIVWNLLDNAVKFSSTQGSVWLSAACQDGEACVAVRDQGRGITPDFLPHLFDRFRQADASMTRRHDGLGLGLALVRHLAELHGGRVMAESPGRNEGATFRVYLPLRPAEPAGPRRRPRDAPRPPPSLAGIRVLLVDDQATARESLGELLRHAGAQVHAAGSCAEALALLEQLGPAGAPGVLLCDIAMPEADGYLTLQRIRAWEERQGIAPAGRMAAVAITAYTQREDRLRALAAGYRLHLAKPVAPAELIAAIAGLGMAPGGGTGRTPRRPGQSQEQASGLPPA